MDKKSSWSKKLDIILFSVIFIYCVVIIVGFLSGYFKKEGSFNNQINQKVSVSGIVSEEAQSKSYGKQFVLEADSGDNILVSSKNTDIVYGDRVSVNGILQLPENFQTSNGTTFDYVSYLYKDDILYQIRNASTTVISSGNGSWVVSKLILLKQIILKSYRKILPSNEASLLGGINLGEKENIDNNFRNDLVTTGTIHIIALSGYNVTIVANALRDFLIQILSVSKNIAAFGGAFGIILFVAMTGFQSSAIRAGIMALIGLFARNKGRTYDAFRALIFAGFIMILWNPKYLVYDISFQLSFLATLGIIFITPILEQKFARIPSKILWFIPIRELMSVTLGAQIGVLPFILYKMGTLSLIALPANIFVLPLIPYTMGIGALAGFVGMMSSAFAYPITLITHLFLKYITGTIEFFAKIPYASVSINNFPLWLCLLLYAILIWIIYRSFFRQRSN